jgi:hypothetical protein
VVAVEEEADDRGTESVGAHISIVDDNVIMMPPQGGGSATRLSTLDTGILDKWVFE